MPTTAIKCDTKGQIAYRHTDIDLRSAKDRNPKPLPQNTNINIDGTKLLNLSDSLRNVVPKTSRKIPMMRKTQAIGDPLTPVSHLHQVTRVTSHRIRTLSVGVASIYSTLMTKIFLVHGHFLRESPPEIASVQRALQCSQTWASIPTLCRCLDCCSARATARASFCTARRSVPQILSKTNREKGGYRSIERISFRGRRNHLGPTIFRARNGSAYMSVKRRFRRAPRPARPAS